MGTFSSFTIDKEKPDSVLYAQFAIAFILFLWLAAAGWYILHYLPGVDTKNAHISLTRDLQLVRSKLELHTDELGKFQQSFNSNSLYKPLLQASHTGTKYSRLIKSPTVGTSTQKVVDATLADNKADSHETTPEMSGFEIAQLIASNRLNTLHKSVEDFLTTNVEVANDNVTVVALSTIQNQLQKAEHLYNQLERTNDQIFHLYANLPSNDDPEWQTKLISLLDRFLSAECKPDCKETYSDLIRILESIISPNPHDPKLAELLTQINKTLERFTSSIHKHRDLENHNGSVALSFDTCATSVVSVKTLQSQVIHKIQELLHTDDQSKNPRVEITVFSSADSRPAHHCPQHKDNISLSVARGKWLHTTVKNWIDDELPLNKHQTKLHPVRIIIRDEPENQFPESETLREYQSIKNKVDRTAWITFSMIETGTANITPTANSETTTASK